MTFVYVHKFDWHSIEHKLMYKGHPKEKRVYRARVSESGIWTIIVPNAGFFMASKLNLKDEAYNSKMVEVTAGNIVDLDIQEEDLDLILMENTDDLPEPIKNLGKAMMEQDNEEKKFIAGVAKVLYDLSLHNTIHAAIIANLCDELVGYNIESVDDPGGKLELDPVNGLGLNVAKAMRALSRYSDPNKKVGEDVSDLRDAAIAIVREMERRITNQLD